MTHPAAGGPRPGWRQRAASSYPLASTHGDTALYVPGAVMVLAGVLRSRSDILGVAMVVLGALVIVVGMLLPTIQRSLTPPPPHAGDDGSDMAQDGSQPRSASAATSFR